VNSTHAAVSSAASFGAELIVNVAACHHWLKLLLPVSRGQPTLNSALAVTKGFGVVSAHSKCRFHGLFVFFNKPISTHADGHFEYFLYRAAIKSRLLQG
jgi:hypothetical protein